MKPGMSMSEGLTFNDVLIIPDKANFMPSQAIIKSRFSTHVDINSPFAASPMDTVCEYRTGIAIAQNGGIGIIHLNMSVALQADQVHRVKRYQSGKILDPYTLSPDHTIGEAKNLIDEKGISGILITNADGRLVGILTRRDLQFENRVSSPVKEVMTAKNLITAPPEITIEEAKKILLEHHIEKLPLVDAEFRVKGLITQKDIQKRRMYPDAAQDEQGRLRVGAAIGADPDGDFRERAQELIRNGVDVLVVDSSHGHSLNVLNAVAALKKLPGMVDVVAGNIVTAEAAEELIEYGANGIRVGIGPGSICTTRIVTGAGMPQITAIIDAAEGVRGRVPIIADGGIQFSGDVTKALVAGADCVMIGSMFAGTEESPGEKVNYKGNMYKRYRGMGSASALHAGGDRYGAKAVPEGVEGLVPYKGALSEVLDMLKGGLRQGMGYAGCRTIEELHARARFVKVSHASMVESHPHDIIITEESPNYPARLITGY